MDLCIVPECYVDTNLIETLVPPAGKGYNHQKGCGTVSRTMQKGLANGFALGIIDKDKKELDYLKEFEEVVVEENLVLYKHTSKPHYIIQIKPAIERFILEAASSAGISVTEFDLPTDLEKFKLISKTEQSKKDVRFKSLFKALKKALVPQISTLTIWVEHLKNNPYSADLESLKRK